MKLKKYLDYLTKLIQEYLKTLKLKIIYIVYDEINDYQKIKYIPSICFASEIKNYHIKKVNF